MIPVLQFGQPLEAVETLPDEAREELVALVRRRLAEHGRQHIVEDVHAAKDSD
jgi:hypothetical protein